MAVLFDATGYEDRKPAPNGSGKHEGRDGLIQKRTYVKDAMT